MRASLLVLVLISGVSSAGCECAPGGPTAPGQSFSGSVVAGGLVFHDLIVPSNTDSVDVRVEWGPANARLRLYQLDPNCDPTITADCRRFTDPLGPSPNGPQTTINGYLSHQGPQATGRVRFVIENLTLDVNATYTAAATPKRHGCDR